MKHKNSGKRKRKVRCTLCTPHRWMGNSKGRFKSKDEQERNDKSRLTNYARDATPSL